MADEVIGQAALLLQVLGQVQYLRLDRDVQRRDRFVADDEILVRPSARGFVDPQGMPTIICRRLRIGPICTGKGRDFRALEA